MSNSSMGCDKKKKQLFPIYDKGLCNLMQYKFKFTNRFAHLIKNIQGYFKRTSKSG